jgi:hypothetical protein
MKHAEVSVGTVYQAKVSGRLVNVRVTAILEHATRLSSGRYRDDWRYRALNLATGRLLLIKSAQRLRLRPGQLPPSAGPDFRAQIHDGQLRTGLPRTFATVDEALGALETVWKGQNHNARGLVYDSRGECVSTIAL